MQANRGPLPGRRFNRQNIEPVRHASRAVFPDKLARHVRKVPLFPGSNGILGRSKFVTRRGPGLHFDKRERLPVIPNQINFSLHAALAEVSRNHHVPIFSQIPVRVRLAANAGAPRLPPRRRSRFRSIRFREPLTRSPIHHSKYRAPQKWHVSLSLPSISSFSVFSVPSVLKLCFLCGNHLTQRAQRTQRKSGLAFWMTTRISLLRRCKLPAFARRMQPALHRRPAAARCESYFLPPPAAATLSRMRGPQSLPANPRRAP
jgi:hypothetical protein